MKYARTSEDTIVEIGEKSQFYTYDNEQIVLEKGRSGTEMIRGLVRKVADTIEELCDEFVIFYNKSKHKVSVLKSMATARLYCKRDKRYNGNCVDKIYGAIWTDKGLIYVAKMNEKGELELL